jgi:hypothetical protein
MVRSGSEVAASAGDERDGEGGLRVRPRADGALMRGAGRLVVVLLTVLLA